MSALNDFYQYEYEQGLVLNKLPKCEKCGYTIFNGVNLDGKHLCEDCASKYTDFAEEEIECSCGEIIHEGDKYYRVDGYIFCEHCVEEI